MPKLKSGRKHFIRLTLLALFLGGCLGAETPSLVHDEHLYIDARLGFAIEHPVSWSKAKTGRGSTTVRWLASAKRGEVSAEAAVTSLPGEPFPGTEELLARYRSEQPQMVEDERAARELPSAPALQVLARSPDRRYLLFFLTTAGRAFILEFSAPPDDFPRQLPLFEEMAESFIPLER